ncbi:MAG: phosphatase PAP2 family protein, partial [Casimicrobium sp.]
LTCTRRSSGGELLRWYFLLLVLFVSLLAFSSAGLTLSGHLHPMTYDVILYKLDSAFGPPLSSMLNRVMKASPTIEWLTRTCYGLVLFAMYVVLGLVLRCRRAEELRLWALIVTPFLLPLIFYNWIPVSGPIYAWPMLFPALPEPGALSLAQTAIPIAPRNAMPSMHLASALLMTAVTMRLRLTLPALLSFVFLVGTAWATLALGEHYLIDLIVAVPFTAALLSFCDLQKTRNTSGTFDYWAIAYVATVLLWMTLISVAFKWLYQAPWALWLLSALSCVVGMTAIARFIVMPNSGSANAT